ncbi:MAG: hypothetical protein C0601_01045 [Candidatus Muiribacterium halophilum]|uniref:Uncharacterized protein n=1 Tax=Muiribacterium halophilum TaxID=2053465 RepID=A0A2N5ZM74_MUIH1|nr:MAG: hypothetical protein C0601_01045 [Candidatus Muirbacterium halophilum]
MAVSQVKKLGIVVTSERKIELIKLLQRFGHVQLIEPEKSDENRTAELQSQISERLKNVQDALELLEKYDNSKSFKDLLKPKTELSPDELENAAKKENEEISTKLNSLKNKLRELEAEISSEQTYLDRITKWRFASVPFNQNESLKYTEVFFVSGKSESVQLIETRMIEEKINAHVCIPEENSSEAILFFIKEHNDKVLHVLSELGIVQEEIESDKLPEELIEEHIKTLKDLKDEYEKIEYEISENIKYQNDIQVLTDHLSILKTQEEGERCFVNTKYCCFVKLWVEKAKANILKKHLAVNIKEIEIMELPIESDENVPVVLSGNALTSPFQSITTMYGIPGRTEFDPTPLFAPFFVLFFGFCLSDAGYGLVILLLSLFGLSLKAIDKDIKKGLVLMTYCGFSTIVIGALAGGWFGLPLETIDNGVSKWLLGFKVVDPNKDALLVMGLSLLLGAIQILWSKLLAMYKAIKNSEYMDAFEEFIWFIYLSVFFPSVVKYAGYIKGQYWLYTVFIYMAIVVIIVALIKSKANIILRPVLSILKLYDTVGYFGDVLSYSRLMALGLATGGVALAINMIAQLAADMIPGVGIIVQIAILIFGHAFNIIINVLGSFIHSMRLQFVEFFQKFFDGGGSMFKPFKLSTKYVRLINK